MKTSTSLILASSSPRRRELLKTVGFDFTVMTSDVDESTQEGLLPHEVVEQLAYRKARAVADRVEKGIVLGSDTVVVLDDIILGKPADEEEAFQMLSSLQGRSTSYTAGLL